ncbi:MAG: glycosyltransferase family 39 protein [Candidatus Moranbacteria bacterium]|nr:glycosyltransferase family 39 protein [Candidatus Moranbacteria bacterium]
MLDKIAAYINSTSKFLWVFILIVIVGIFLRTYNFSDWLRFNADQARDASVARTMVEEGVIPLLGPVAGGTDFRIGPMSIYFQSLGAWIFGTAPDNMAYADLLFGILSVPLIFLFLREYFSVKAALASTALYAVSFFAVQYSRFAWNSNSAQFFVVLLLYAIIRTAYGNGGKKFLWAAVSGIAFGVAVQLHTLLLFSVPLFFVIIWVHLVRHKKINIAHIAVIVAVAVTLNAPQIVNEVRTGQANATAFFSALIKKSPKQSSLGGNILHVAACQVQANAKILLPQNDQEKCGFPFTEDNLEKITKKDVGLLGWIAYGAELLFAIAFSAVGYYLITRRAFREKDGRKRIFFAVIFAYCVSLLLVSFPFGREISLRYFILTAFVPYLFVALLVEWSMAKTKPAVVWSFVGAVFFYNLYFCAQVFSTYAGSSGNMIDGSMPQAKSMAEYLMESSAPHRSFQVGGKNTDLGRFVDRASYFVNGAGMSIIELDDQKNVDPELPFFVAVSEMSKKCQIASRYKDYGEIEACKQIGEVTILKIRTEEK